MLTRFLNWLLSFFRPHPAPAAVSAPVPVPRKPHNWHASRIARQRAQIDAVNNIGRGYARVPVAAPEGYFWKQDEGCLDGVGSRRWRLYQKPVKGI